MDHQNAAMLSEVERGCVTCKNSHDENIRGALLHFDRYLVSFEVYSPSLVLHASEVLKDFKIMLNGQATFSGKAVVSKLVNAGTALVCEATLDDCWVGLHSFPSLEEQLRDGFDDFLTQWQRTYKVQPEFKLVVADLHSLLMDLRLWLDQIELSIRSAPAEDQAETEREAAQRLAKPILSAIDVLGDRFEEIATGLTAESRPAHVHFTRRNLHPLLLCSPFAYRTFHKPLGYAGDYGMVNMIVGNPYEGASLFAKVINAWFLNQLPAQAHRHRIQFLKRRLIEETARTLRQGRPAQVFNLGCGPAGEIQEYLAESSLSDHTGFALRDFNDETIQHTSRVLGELRQRHGRQTVIKLQKQSVQQLLKEALKRRADPAGRKYDFLYCAGLFDYLPDKVCKHLMEVFYEWVTPGGLLLVTNVDGTRPFHNKLEFILDWNLIYRSGRQMAALKPVDAPVESCSITADVSSVNVFLEIRKPQNA